MDARLRKRPLNGPACLRLRLLVVAGVCLLAAAGGSASAKPPASFDPLVEAKNFAITLQRQAIYDTPSYQAKLSAISAGNLTNALATPAADHGARHHLHPLGPSPQTGSQGLGMRSPPARSTVGYRR